MLCAVGRALGVGKTFFREKEREKQEASPLLKNSNSLEGRIRPLLFLLSPFIQYDVLSYLCASVD